MPFQVSPGVNVSEIDLTTIVPAISTTEAGIVMETQWGPMDERILVTNEDDLVFQFWKPNNDIANRWFTAANFLAYGNKLWVVRVAQSGANTAYNATSGGSGLLVKNDEHYENNYENGQGSSGNWVAKYAGALGNNLKVSICPSANAFESTLGGTLAVSANGTVVTGTSTAFTGNVVAGDILTLNSEEVKVSSVTNSTSLILTAAHASGAVANASVTRNWEYFRSVDRAPGTTEYANNISSSADEMHVAVVDEDGGISKVTGTVLEVYETVSWQGDNKTENGSIHHYKDVVNQRSKWIRWMDYPTTVTNAGSNTASVAFGSAGVPITESLAGGRRGGIPSNGTHTTGWDKFKDDTEVDVSFLMGGDANQTIALHMINLIAESRKDCIAVLSPLRQNVVNNEGSERADIITFRNTLPSSSYATIDTGWKYQYDKYNDVYRYVPCNGDTTGLMVRTDNTRDPWWSPAGYNRGGIKSVIKLAYNPKKADRDLLYKRGINPVITQPGQGTLLFGDKTMLTKPSAFDRINVRRLFIVLEKAIATASKYTLFEFNDEFTRAQFRNMVEPFLRDVQGRRGIYDFRVVADETNNTGEVIDRNEFIGDIYIKPARAINFIQLNFVAVRTGVEFSEVVGKF